MSKSIATLSRGPAGVFRRQPNRVTVSLSARPSSAIRTSCVLRYSFLPPLQPIPRAQALAMPFSQPFDDAFRGEVAVLTRDSTLSNTALYDDAALHLRVLPHPSFAEINQPPWVRRIQKFTRMWVMYTSSSFFNALYQTTDQLGLAGGKRYVSATICVSAIQAESAATAGSPQDIMDRRVAEALAELATAWAAHFLWPCKFLSRSRCLSRLAGESDSLQTRRLRRWNEDRLRSARKAHIPQARAIGCDI